VSRPSRFSRPRPRSGARTSRRSLTWSGVGLVSLRRLRSGFGFRWGACGRGVGGGGQVSCDALFLGEVIIDGFVDVFSPRPGGCVQAWCVRIVKCQDLSLRMTPDALNLDGAAGDLACLSAVLRSNYGCDIHGSRRGESIA